MALDFPDVPTADQEFVTPKVTFAWTGGTRWRRKDGTPPPVAVLPTLAQLIPPSGNVNSPDVTVRVLGTEFIATTELLWDGVSVQRTLISPTEMTVVVPLTGATVGIVQVAARNDTLTSNELPWEYLAALTPYVFMIDPSHGLVNAAHTATVNGQMFTAACVVYLDSTPLATTFVSATELTVAIPASAVAGTHSIIVTDGVINWPSDAAITFTYDPIPLVLTSFTPPSSIVQPSIFPAVEINGSGFNANCWVWWNGVMQSTTYVSPTKLTANSVDHNTTGTFPVYVKDSQNANQSNTLNYYITSNQPPLLTSVSPNSAVQGTTIATLTVTGQNFVNGKRIVLAGVPVATTYVNATTLTTTNVFATFSELRIPVTVEECPGEVAVNLTGAPGSVTIDYVKPDLWPNNFNGSPYENKNGVFATTELFDTDEVYINDILHNSWPDQSNIGNKALMFQATHLGQDPSLVQRTKLTIRRGGVPSANHFVFIIGG